MGKFIKVVTLLLYLNILRTCCSVLFYQLPGYKFSGAVISSTVNMTNSRCTQMCVSHARNGKCLGVNFVSENEPQLGTCEVNTAGSRLVADASAVAIVRVDYNAPDFAGERIADHAVTSNVYFEFNASTEAVCRGMCQSGINCSSATYTTSGVCKLSSDKFYSVTATSETEQGSVTLFPVLPISCLSIYMSGKTASGTYKIDSDGMNNGVHLFEVECNMTTNPPRTIAHHDSEARTSVTPKCEEPGCYSLTVTYLTATVTQLVALVDSSNSCRQHIKYECHDSVMTSIVSPTLESVFFHNRDDAPRYYWGGSNPTNGGCACKLDNFCAQQVRNCNCNANDNTWREDSGYLETSADLPVTKVRAGDTDGSNEHAFVTLGPLECT